MSEISPPQWPQFMEEINAALPLLDGATVEWWGFAVSHGHSVWKLTGLPQGVGYIFMVSTRYVHFPLIMHNVKIRVATSQETDALRGLLSPQDAESLQEQFYHTIECEEGTFSIWSRSFAVLWGERNVKQMLWEV